MARPSIRVAIHGVPGRMGTRLVQLVEAAPDLVLGAAIGRPGHPELGKDVGPLVGLPERGVALVAGLDAAVDVVVAFSEPRATLEVAAACARSGIPLVVGTTGFDPEAKAQLGQYGRQIALLASPNTSQAVNILMKLVGEAARLLHGADIEVVERHHRFKKDAPSGTAIRLAEVAAEAIGSARLIHGRSGLTGERPADEIGIHALRTGDNPGEHTVVFGLMGESLELTHRALNRDGFARGALEAARFLVGRPPGLYTMTDLLSGSTP